MNSILKTLTIWNWDLKAVRMKEEPLALAKMIDLPQVYHNSIQRFAAEFRSSVDGDDYQIVNSSGMGCCLFMPPSLWTGFNELQLMSDMC